VLHIQSVSKQFGSKTLFESAEAHLGYRSRAALIGPNGSGKSTLIRLIMGQESADIGVISRGSHLAIGHLPQEVPKFSGRTALAEAMRMDGRREDLLVAKRELEQTLSKDASEASASTLEHYGRVMEELEHLDEYRLESRAKEILSGMGFKPSDFDRPLTQFSGGWLMRVALSRVLLMDPDLLILDEPTNHLDLETLLWLEDFLRAFRGAMLLVSHDTAFLNRIVHEVLEIDQKRLWTYRGNLDSYVLQKEERLQILRSQYESQQTKIAEIESFVARFGAKATKARQAQSRLKQLDRMERIELDEGRETVRFRFPPASHSGKEVVTMKNVSVRYGENVVFRNLNWVIQRGSRVAIVGVNGAGKTTLLKLLSGTFSATEGQVKMGHLVKTGYYAQHQAESLDFSKTVLQELEMTAPEMPVSQVRGIAGAFLFSGDAVEKKCSVLSGGEKARVALAKLLLSPSNFLLLDEPTNHLDPESRAVLLEALQNYTGTLCLVSHDRNFVSPLVDLVLEIVPSDSGSEVHQLIGTYDDYLERKMKEMAQKATAPSETQQKSTTPEAQKRSGPSNNQRIAWARERDNVEGEIGKLEARQAELHELLANTATYDDKVRSMALAEEQRQLELNLGNKLARWEELCNLLSEVGL